ncbi:MAG: type VI secretion system tip protein VgrG [Gammaproteobacteria bacterium]|nr:type VI secretion system tip protein VgrG [Gammaproteobacteria bacterium]
MYHQKNRFINLDTASGERTLLVKQFRGVSHLFRGFEFYVDVLSTDKNMVGKNMLMTPAAISVQASSHQTHYFHGMITHFERGERDGHFYYYRIILQPNFDLLKMTQQFRIFQHKTVPDIIKTILHERKIVDIEFKLKETYQEREYCCQYGENTHDFLHRLMEEEGIFYFYVHHKNKHTIVFVDSIDSFSCVGEKNNHFSAWFHKEAFHSGKIVLTDYVHQRPSAGLTVMEEDERGIHDRHYHPGGFSSVSEGNKKMKLHKLSYDMQAITYGGEGEDFAVMPGKKFLYQGNEFYFLSVDYVASDQSYSSQGSEFCQVMFSCRPCSAPYKPIQKRVKPKVMGVETALVLGKEGSELEVDEQGRVRVKFHWEYTNKAEGSCWLRVAQLWAGHLYGMQFLPRVGQEVLVQFVQGDPDRPLIMGSLFNAEQQPPYKLPEHKTRSGIKTRSMPNGDVSSGNELSFEDKKDKEEIFLHAEKDFRRVIEDSELCLVKKGDFQVTVSKGQIVLSADKKLILKVEGSKIEMDEEGIVIFSKKLVVKS